MNPFKDEIDDLTLLLPTSEPYIKDDTNNTFTHWTTEPEPKIIEVLKYPRTDHVLMSCSYNGGYVAGGNVAVNLFLNHPSDLNKEFGIPLYSGHYKYPYKEETIELSEGLAKYLMIGITDDIREKKLKRF